MKDFILALVLIAAPSAACAAQVPVPGKADSRVRYVAYNQDDVTTIHVQRGTATRIVLGADEKIVGDGAATGFAADCSKQEFEWCIRAEPGSNQLLVKPRDGATHNNLELRTDKRDYSFAFRVLPDPKRSANSARASPGTRAPMYRVIFRYPNNASQIGHDSANVAGDGNATMLARRLDGMRPKPSNWRYSMQAFAGSADIVPSLVFDDGRFTYLRFPANRERPTIYAVSPFGEESRVNFHIDHVDGSLLVIERLARRLVLRLGDATVGIWNDAFNVDGTAPVDGTTVKGVARDLRNGGRK